MEGSIARGLPAEEEPKGYTLVLAEIGKMGIRFLNADNIRVVLVPNTLGPGPACFGLGHLEALDSVLLSMRSESSPIHSLLMAISQLRGSMKTVRHETDVRREGTSWARFDFAEGTITDGIGKAIDFMKRAFREDITLEQIARVACLSPCHFSRLFRKQIGTTCKKFLSSLRMREALRLLAETKMRVTEVSLQSGFNELTQFERVFKATTGLTPSRYKAKLSPGRV